MKKVFFAIATILTIFLTSCSNENNAHQSMLRLKNLATGTIESLKIDSASNVFHNGDTVVLESGYSTGGYEVPQDLGNVIFNDTLPGTKFITSRSNGVSIHTFTKFLLLEGGKTVSSVQF